jgi:hypothetical protein
MEKQVEAENADTQQTRQGQSIASWASILLDYFDQKARLLAVESKEASQGQNGINGGQPVREEPVCAGFELELAGAERYRTGDQTRHRGIYLFPCRTLDRPR